MKAILIMFDSLNRRMLPSYGCDWVHAPNFSRLQQRSAVFDNSYIGSMPCMPARREFHTGRYNFLHRSWGPLEPFDDSMPQLLKQNGVYTHLVSDHYHYWEDGGCTYHSRYSSWEIIRGQEGDPWKGEVRPPDIPADRIGRNIFYTPKFYINKKYITDDNPTSAQTFALGAEFIHKNAKEDNWFLQIEAFDPHEPFFAPKKYEDLYPHDYDGPEFDWPDYAQVKETKGQVEHVRKKYAASLSMCDAQLGKILDLMDQYDMWGDTMLIVCTDHGFLLGEHGWWAKNRAPYYNEVAHTPLYIWDPRSRVKGERRQSVVQMIDFAPTLLEYFNVKISEDMQGKSLKETIAKDAPVRDAALFGLHGGHVGCTDGRYVYLRAPANEDNTPIYSYTLMPTTNATFFTMQELHNMELVGPLPFTKGCKVLKVKYFGRPKNIGIRHESFLQGTMLFDVVNDPLQEKKLTDWEAESMMIGKMLKAMKASDCPPEQYERLGLEGNAV